MAFNSNGQISYLILDSLADGSKYGLEIIEFISKQSGGNYILKKPTLYSCLSRMEKKGLVSSSYWGESELGGKRHYYTITSDGRRSLEELSREFKDMPIMTDEPKISDKTEEVEKESVEEPAQEENKPVFLQQDNMFDLVKEPEKPAPAAEEEKSDILDNQLDIFSMPTPENNLESEQNAEHDQEKMQYYQSILESNQTPQDDGKFLDKTEKVELTPYQEEQNRRIYDTSTELKKYRKKKSFSENQIEMSVVYENAEDREIQRNRIEQLKQSMLSARDNYNLNKPAETEKVEESEDKPEEKSFFYKTEQVDLEKLEEKDEPKDDARFITEPRIDETQIPIQKKITPPNIEVNIYDDNLPAPKRDSNLEPTYKDMMAKLFERKKEKKEEVYVPPVEESQNYNDIESFADYNSLKKYYASHNIDFKEYKKTTVERNHNTNFLKFVASTILFLLSGIGCAILFGIISAAGKLQASTNFMFYTVPILFFVAMVYEFVKFKVMPSKKAALIYGCATNWIVFGLLTIITVVINIIAGMQYETIADFLTSLLVPIFGLLLAFPINYHTKKYLYRKYAK